MNGPTYVIKLDDYTARGKIIRLSQFTILSPEEAWEMGAYFADKFGMPCVEITEIVTTHTKVKRP